jgi:hypothetical protein
MAMPRQGQDMSRGHDSRLSRTLINCNFMMRVAEPGWLAGRRQRAVRAYQNGCPIGAQDGPDRQREPDCRGESHRCRHLGVEPMARAEGEGPKGETSSAGSLLTRRWREMDSNFQFAIAKPRSASRHGGPSWLLGYGSGSVGGRRFESISLQQRVCELSMAAAA